MYLDLYTFLISLYIWDSFQGPYHVELKEKESVKTIPVTRVEEYYYVLNSLTLTRKCQDTGLSFPDTDSTS